jgi:hypothetical protein
MREREKERESVRQREREGEREICKEVGVRINKYSSYSSRRIRR